MQVKHQDNQVSACAVVRGLHRNLFVVPSSNALANDEELKTLERVREADPSQPKGPLMKRLHVKLPSCMRLLLTCQNWQQLGLIHDVELFPDSRLSLDLGKLAVVCRQPM